MIIGAHSILYSTNPDADRAFLADALKLPGVDVGGGWIILGLPPAEVAVHPGDKNDVHELYLMVDDIGAFVADMKHRGIACSAPQEQGWGVLTRLSLPGGGRLGVYEPRHARPPSMLVAKPLPKAAPRKTKRPASKRAARKPARPKGKRR